LFEAIKWRAFELLVAGKLGRRATKASSVSGFGAGCCWRGVVVLLGFHCVAELGFQEEEEEETRGERRRIGVRDMQLCRLPN